MPPSQQGLGTLSTTPEVPQWPRRGHAHPAHRGTETGCKVLDTCPRPPARQERHTSSTQSGRKSALFLLNQVLLSARCPQLGCKPGWGGQECGAPSDGYFSGTPGKGPHWLQSGGSCRGTPERDLKWTFPPTSALRAGLFLLGCQRCASSHCGNPQPGS